MVSIDQLVEICSKNNKCINIFCGKPNVGKKMIIEQMAKENLKNAVIVENGICEKAENWLENNNG